jgi:hypothetical protein
MAYDLQQVTKSIHLPTNLLDSDRSSGAQNIWAGQEFPAVYNPKVYYCVNNTSNLNHLNTVHTTTSKFCKGKLIPVHTMKVQCSLDSPSPDWSDFRFARVDALGFCKP